MPWLQGKRHQELLSSNTRNRFRTILFSRKAVGKLEFMQRDIDDWKITFVDTGLRSTIADRLRLIEPYLNGEEMFLANYSDGLTDFPLPEMIEEFWPPRWLRFLSFGAAALEQPGHSPIGRRRFRPGNSDA